MMKSIAAAAIAFASISCALQPAVAGPSQPAAPAKPQYGDSGFDKAGAAFDLKAGDDFFRYANGTWLDHTDIPGDKPGYSLRIIMSDNAEQRILDILKGAAAGDTSNPKTNEQRIGAFYKSFMDEDRIESLGAKPLQPLLDAVTAAPDKSALAALMGHNNSDFNGTIFGFYSDVDLKNPKVYALYVGQAGLGLPDRDYYLKPEFAAQKAQYQTYVATMLKLVGWKDPDASATAIVAFETRIAEASWSRVQQRDPVATYNPMPVAKLASYAPGFDWNAMFRAAGFAKLDRVVIGEKTALPKIAAIFAQTSLDTLKAWQAFTITDYAAPYLSKDFTDATFEMRTSSLSGQKEQSARWKLGVHAVSGGDYLAGDRFDRIGNLGWAVGEVYAARYFPADAKAKIEKLVGNLKAAYHARLEKLDWMGPKTRAQALKKLETYTIKVGYPDKPWNYGNLVIRDDDLIGNVRRTAAQVWSHYVARHDGPVDRGEWIMTPQTNDAYNGSLRDIVFPAGILQAPIFDPNADPAFNYGAAGGIIGHELTHGFDDQGRKIDAEGKLRDWWTPKDAAAFVARAKELSRQYSSFEPVPGVHINGDLTLGENIADLGGLTLALDAYRTSLGGKPSPVIDGLTGDQRVFLGWAQAWRGKFREDYIRKQVVTDPHSPRAFRVNGVVRNIDSWYGAFGVKPGEKLFVPPADRVRIW